MERLVRLYRSGSSPAALAILVAVNLVPLAGVLFWGWNLWSILVLYWVENGIVGVINVFKILLAGGGMFPGPAKVAIVPFFLVHYGIFWLVHGLFILTFLPMFVPPPSGFPAAPPFDGGPLGGLAGIDAVSVGPRWDVILGAAAGLAISHAVSFFLNYVGRREYLTASPMTQAFAPYSRVVTLHLTIILGAFVSIALGSPIGALVVLVGMKTAIDVALHLRERRAAIARVEGNAGPTRADPQPGPT